MKHAQFNKEPIKAKFRLSEPKNMPILSANPSVISLNLQPDDSFLIFASDGLWEHLSNEEAVDIVHNNPRVVRFFFTLYLFLLKNSSPFQTLIILLLFIWYSSACQH